MAASEDNQLDKRTLRTRLLADRAAVTPAAAAHASAAVCVQVAQLPAVQRARVVALYRGARGEINPSPLHAVVLRAGGRAVFPRFSRRSADLSFHAVESLDAMELGALAIAAPSATAPVVATGDIDVFIIPGVAFDRAGGRLGQGRGYYDRALAAAPAALRVGVAHDFQLVDRVPREAHDQSVDCIVTPSGTLRTHARAALAAADEVP